MSHIKIALIDDHTLFRSGIKALLSRQNDFEVIGEAADGLAHGVLSHLNERATQAGLRAGMAVQDAVRLLDADPDYPA